jgi:hypothetical protein
VITASAAVAAPRVLRAFARIGVGLYAGAVGVETVRAARHATPRVAAGLPMVFVTLHGAWGLGFLVGTARFGAARAILQEQVGSLRARRDSKALGAR